MFLLLVPLKFKLYESFLLLNWSPMNSPEHQDRKPIPLIALLVLFGIAIVGNISLTLYYRDSSSAFISFDFFIALGLLIAQPCVLSIWCALGGQRAMVRIWTSMGMLIALTIVYVGLLIGNDVSSGEFVLVLSGISIAISAIIQIPLWIFRASTKQVIVLPTETDPNRCASQFKIKHLLISTTIAAIVVAVAKANAEHVRFDERDPWFSVGLLLAFFIVVASVQTFLILAVVFNRNHRLVFVAFLGGIMIAAPFATWAVFQSLPELFGEGGDPVYWEVEEFINAYCFFCSLASGIMGVLFIFYAIGFRLRKVGPEN